MANAKSTFQLAHFLYDRGFFILAFALQTIGILFVVQLDFFTQGHTLPFSTIAYILILSAIFLGSLLFIDFVRQINFLRSLRDALQETDDLHALIRLQSGVTREQRAVKTLVEEMYRTYTAQLHRHKAQYDEHITFIKQWVHAIKTPLSVIDLTLQSWKKEHISNKSALISSLQEETERVSEGLHMMLHTARMNEFEVDVHFRAVNLNQIIQDEINSLKSAFIRNKVYPKLVVENKEGTTHTTKITHVRQATHATHKTDVPYETETSEATKTRSVFVESDDKWLAFVIRQLLTNAIKYHKNTGGAQVRCTLREMDTSTELIIADNGIGIPHHDLKRVFRPFFTGENGRIGRESTGMGLYLAKQICDRLGHRMHIDSSTDKTNSGTTVTITFSVQSIFKRVTSSAT